MEIFSYNFTVNRIIEKQVIKEITDYLTDEEVKFSLILEKNNCWTKEYRLKVYDNKVQFDYIKYVIELRDSK